ncbi:MAG: phosphoglucosamine mutase [Pseudomonadota bacterium]|nr:phosphoglucosamine mutase [Pseudomonadota bacterium]
MSGLFGTDGIRGRVGHSPVRPEDVLKIGWAAGTVLRRQGRGSQIILGKDTRVSGYLFESLLEAGFIAAGMDTALTGPLPTPAIAHLTTTSRASAGIVISASHNPYHDNGIKFFQGNGHKLDDQTEEQIEELFDQPMITAEHLGKATRFPQPAGRYIEFCKHTFPQELSLRGVSVVLDCANGACYDLAPRVFRELGATVYAIGIDPDGYNINRNCGTECTDLLVQTVIDQQADIGIAFDGDGDRLRVVDETGTVLDGDAILFILSHHRQQSGVLTGGVVGTIMSNHGFERSLQRQGISLHRTEVGDRYVLEALQSRGWCLGGEPSGHIVCRDKVTTGDGIVAALEVLHAMQFKGVPLSALITDLQYSPQAHANVPMSVSVADRTAVLREVAVRKTLDEVEALLGVEGRVVVRCSGTEPVVRVMVEGQDQRQVQQYCEQIVTVISGLQIG